MSDEKAAFKQHYDAEASRYDAHRYACRCKRLISELQQAFVLDVLGDVGHVLDAGCGTGRFSIPLAERGVQVVAVDASPAMLAVARRKAGEAGVASHITFVQGDVEHLSFAPGSFDGAVSIAVLRHFPSPAVGIGELARVLRPGGAMALDYLNGHVFRFYEPLRGLFVRNPNVPNEHFFTNYYSTLPEVRGFLTANGVQLVRRHGLSKFPAHMLLCRLRLGTLAGPLQALERRVNLGAVVMVGGRKL
ncbi:MAG: class I SAM-dependent methyltransferase [Chloroflexi bacterium]|nr:class I SAM-dependent methyltransferase [Chloroflexota bacterium]MBU1748885.1 class I SAM-dependent methyltransferase [Chloroflexota bacterium]